MDPQLLRARLCKGSNSWDLWSHTNSDTSSVFWRRAYSCRKELGQRLHGLVVLWYSKLDFPHYGWAPSLAQSLISIIYFIFNLLHSRKIRPVSSRHISVVPPPQLVNFSCISIFHFYGSLLVWFLKMNCHASWKILRLPGPLALIHKSLTSNYHFELHLLIKQVPNLLKNLKFLLEAKAPY